MRPAAVGFHCPDCVKQGQKAVRSARTPYGGTPRSNPGLVSQLLIGANVAVWLLVTLTGGASSPWVVRLGLVPAGRCESFDGRGFFPGVGERLCATGGSWVDGVASGAVWQLLTSAFTHVDLWHVGFNMLALWVLGPQLEAVLGRRRFLALYLLSALAGSLFVLWLSPPAGITIGASGAVFGLMGALLVVVLRQRLNPSFLLVWLGINVVITVTGRAFISWQGHLGGFVGGLLAAAVLVWAPRQGRTGWQVAGLAALAAVTAVLTAVRTFQLG